MISCRYVGGDASMIGDREFDAVGQRAVLSEQGYREAVLGGAAFIPEEAFQKIGFTPVQLDQYGPVGLRLEPPAEFCDKLILSQQVFRDIRDDMLLDSQRVLVDAADASAEPEPVVGLQ